MSDLKSRLIRSAESWAAAHDCGLSRIGKRVAGDANFFARLESTDATCNVTTLERFARFLGDPANWPEAAVPDAVREFVHVVGITPDSPDQATGQSAALSGQAGPKAAAA